MKKAFPALVALSMAATPVAAQDRTTLGFGRIFHNDSLGDGRDRWRTGGYSVSMLRGTGWQGQLPARMGEILEYRVRGEIVAPANLARPDPGDRRYAGVVSIGMHTHFDLGGYETRLGLDLVGVGPATGLGRFQSWVHGIVDLPKPDLSQQVGNGLYPTLSAEIGRSLGRGAVRVRPFAEAQAGIETFLRVGADVTVGGFGTGALMLRDTTTGQRHAGVRGDAAPGFSLMFGGDVARVYDSALFPAGGPRARDSRERLRVGVHWQGAQSDVFYGLTRLGREFEGQPEAQTVGSIRFRVKF